MSPNASVKQLGSIMGLWAHPDDESFMTGGLLAIASQQGQKTCCITATRGEAGLQDPDKWSDVDLGQERAKEIQNALSCLGDIEHHWLDYEDGRCHQISNSEALADILPLVTAFRPDTIITFPPDGLTGHFDHQAVSRWARLVKDKCDWPMRVLYAADNKEEYDQFVKAADEKFNIYFNVQTPALIPKDSADLRVDLGPEIIKKKIASLKAMVSQTEGMFKEVGEEWFEKAFCCEIFVDSNRQDIKWNTEFLEVPA